MADRERRDGLSFESGFLCFFLSASRVYGFVEQRMHALLQYGRQAERGPRNAGSHGDMDDGRSARLQGVQSRQSAAEDRVLSVRTGAGCGTLWGLG